MASCASKSPEQENKEPDARPQLVGRVASIPPERSFLLIQSYGEWRVPDGTILSTRGQDGRTANLFVTGEKLGQYAAADIQAGEVEVGDAVLQLPTPAPRPDSPPDQGPNLASETENTP